MPDNSLTSGTPQFSTAEYAKEGGADRCKSCGELIGAEYYRVNNAIACPACAQKAAGSLPIDSHAKFVRGVTFGLGGAILGMAIYAACGILTGLVIGYVALGVGYIVARAIKMGSGGIGGQRYQIAAAVLTYMAVSMAAVPMTIAQIVKAKKAHPAVSHLQLLQSPQADGVSANHSLDHESDTDSVPQSAAPAKHELKIGALVGSLLVAGLSSPFYELWQRGPSIGPMIGLLILFIGVRIAWQMTAASGPVGVLGPFKT
jgi:hypothetical protein